MLTQALFRWRPDCIPTVLAIDAARGWLLMRDSGVTPSMRLVPGRHVVPYLP